jgi:putative N6-adenine-specific DNA methylase
LSSSSRSDRGGRPPPGRPPARRPRDAQRPHGAQRRERPHPDRDDTQPTKPRDGERFFATCPRGLEQALADELTALDARNARATDGGVAFEGPQSLAYSTNLWSRLASRILWQVGSCRYRDQQDIFDAALKLPWQRWFAVGDTIRVNVTAIRSPLASIDFITLKIKDAVCDRFRLETGARPSVDTAQPAVRIHAFLTTDTCTFYLDTSGEALFKRGYRRDALAAPLRENLAAGLLALSGWRPGTVLCDPFCGSGTILIEAAMIASDIAPGHARAFGFERLSWFDAKAWGDWRATAKAREEAGRESAVAGFHGIDVDADAIEAATSNLSGLGLARLVSLSCGDARTVAAPAPAGIVVTNPPYGVRLGADDDLRALYADFANNLKRRFAGWNAWLLCGELSLVKAIRLAPSRKIPLYNGALECRLVEYRMVAGSNRKP